MQNFKRECKHVFESVEAQLEGARICAGCIDREISAWSADCNEGWTATIDLLVSGSPCDPYSCQRPKRFADGSVKDHKDYETTMTSVVAMYQKYQPHVGIMEQVMGFTKPMSTTSAPDDTPYRRPALLQKFGMSVEPIKPVSQLSIRMLAPWSFRSSVCPGATLKY